MMEEQFTYELKFTKKMELEFLILSAQLGVGMDEILRRSFRLLQEAIKADKVLFVMADGSQREVTVK